MFLKTKLFAFQFVLMALRKAWIHLSPIPSLEIQTAVIHWSFKFVWSSKCNSCVLGKNCLVEPILLQVNDWFEISFFFS